MRGNSDKIKSIFKKKNQLIVVIIVAVIVIISIIAIEFIMSGEKAITAESESGIGTEFTTSTNSVEKTACGIKIKFIYADKYWEKYDLTNAVYKTQDEYEDAVCNYIEQIAELLNKQDWYKQYKDKDTLYLKLVIQGKEFYAQTKQHLEEYEDTMSMNYTLRSSTLEDYTPKGDLYTMTFNSAMFDHNIVPLVHQLTELITYNKDISNQRTSSLFSSSIKMGLGEYTQSYLGMGISSCNHGLDIHNYVIEHEKICESDTTLNSSSKKKGLFWTGVTYGTIGTTSFGISSVGTSSVGTSSPETSSVGFSSTVTLSSLDSQNFGVECCSSFVAYLVQTYGIENVMKMVDGYDDSIYYLFNPNGLEGLKSDWQTFLVNYQCKMTWDEINVYITEFRRTHGY